MATWPAEVRPNLQAIMRADSVMELKSCSCVESKYLYHVPTCQRMDQQGVQNVATPTSSCVRGVKKGVSWWLRAVKEMIHPCHSIDDISASVSCSVISSKLVAQAMPNEHGVYFEKIVKGLGCHDFQLKWEIWQTLDRHTQRHIHSKTQICNNEKVTG